MNNPRAETDAEAKSAEGSRKRRLRHIVAPLVIVGLAGVVAVTVTFVGVKEVDKTQCLSAEKAYQLQLDQLEDFLTGEERVPTPKDTGSLAVERLLQAQKQADFLLEKNLPTCIEGADELTFQQRRNDYMRATLVAANVERALVVAAADVSDNETIQTVLEVEKQLNAEINQADDQLTASSYLQGTEAYEKLDKAITSAKKLIDSNQLDPVRFASTQKRREYLNKERDQVESDISGHFEADEDINSAHTALQETVKERKAELEAASGAIEATMLDLADAENALSLDSALAGSVAGWDVGIAVIDLQTGRQIYSYNADQMFPAASTYKVYVMYDMMQKIMAGDMTWEDTVDGYRLAYCQEEMILRSENACAEGWLHQYGYDHMEQLAHKLGSTSTTFAPGQIYTNAADLANFMKQLYNGEGLDKENQDLFLDLLETQHYRNGMPSGLAGSAVVADKIGFLPGYRHDGGIVYGDKGNYVIAILTNNMGNPQIASISRIIYNWL